MTKRKSSKTWLKEHFDDPYVKQAHKEGYRSRAVYKLLEIQQKDKLIKPGMNVVDLGAAPGSWCEIVKDTLKDKGHLFALDILPMEPIEGVEFIQGDFTQEAVLNQLIQQIGDHNIDVVLSDMAPNITGMSAVDQPRAMYLAELALEFATHMLKANGAFLVKVFQGEGFDEYLKTVRQSFGKVTIRKPNASRPRSREVYILGRVPRATIRAR